MCQSDQSAGDEGCTALQTAFGRLEVDSPTGAWRIVRMTILTLPRASVTEYFPSGVSTGFPFLFVRTSERHLSGFHCVGGSCR